MSNMLTIRDVAKAEDFCLILKDFKSFVDIINITFSPDHMYIQSMDSSHVMLVEVCLPDYWFDQYHFDQSITIGLNTAMLQKIVKARDKSQSLELSFNDEKLSIHYFHSLDKTGGGENKEFNIALIDNDSELLQIPDDEFSSEFSLASDRFTSLVSDLKEFGDSMMLDVSEQGIVFTSSNDSSNATVRLSIDELDAFSIDEGEHICSSFGLKYIKDISAFHKIAKTLLVQFSPDKPLKLSYLLVNNKHSDCDEDDDYQPRIVFYVAPLLIE
jgi:proliferating cell nuclear antigen